MYSLFLLFALTLFDSPGYINKKGNKLYRQDKYEKALEQYKKAQVKDPKLMILDYNIGCSQYKMGEYKEALQSFTRIISSLEDKELKDKSIYNIGNTLFKSGDLESAIEMYKQSLRINPNDMNAKISLEFTQKKLEERKKQKQENKDKKDKKDQKQKNKQNQDKDNQKQKDKKEQDKKQKKEQQEKEKQEQKFSKESAKNLLEALQQDEKASKKKSTEKGKVGKIGVVKDW